VWGIAKVSSGYRQLDNGARGSGAGGGEIVPWKRYEGRKKYINRGR